MEIFASEGKSSEGKGDASLPWTLVLWSCSWAKAGRRVCGLPCYPEVGGICLFLLLLSFPLSLLPPPSLLGLAASLGWAGIVLALLSPDLAGFPDLWKDVSLELPCRSDEEGSTF